MRAFSHAVGGAQYILGSKEDDLLYFSPRLTFLKQTRKSPTSIETNSTQHKHNRRYKESYLVPLLMRKPGEREML